MVPAMMVGHEIAERAERTRAGIAKAYGVKADTLQTALKQAGKQLPNRVRMQAQTVLDAQLFGGNPKLLRRVDLAGLAAAEADVQRHLKTIDRSAARRGATLNWVAQAGFYVFLVFGSVLLWIAMTGRL